MLLSRHMLVTRANLFWMPRAIIATSLLRTKVHECWIARVYPAYTSTLQHRCFPFSIQERTDNVWHLHRFFLNSDVCEWLASWHFLQEYRFFFPEMPHVPQGSWLVVPTVPWWRPEIGARLNPSFFTSFKLFQAVLSWSFGPDCYKISLRAAFSAVFAVVPPFYEFLECLSLVLNFWAQVARWNPVFSCEIPLSNGISLRRNDGLEVLGLHESSLEWCNHYRCQMMSGNCHIVETCRNGERYFRHTGPGSVFEEVLRLGRPWVLMATVVVAYVSGSVFYESCISFSDFMRSASPDKWPVMSWYVLLTPWIPFSKERDFKELNLSIGDLKLKLEPFCRALDLKGIEVGQLETWYKRKKAERATQKVCCKLGG